MAEPQPYAYMPQEAFFGLDGHVDMPAMSMMTKTNTNTTNTAI
jgi:hypothetical protein